MLGFKGLAWRERRAAADPAQAQADAADRRLSPHPDPAGGRRPVVRHPPDRPRARAARALADASSPTARAAMARRSPGGPSISSCGPSALFVSGINADHMPEPACTRTAPACTACRRPRSRRCARRRSATAISCGRRSVAGRHARTTAGRTCWATGPASPTSPPITSSGSIAAATSTAAPSSIPIRASSPGATAWPRSATARAPRSTRTRRWPPPAHAEPAPPRPSDPQDGDPRPGERARVRPADNARDWVEGEVQFHRRRTRSRCCATIPRSARSPSISRGWATTGARA